ncbi:serine hydrolase domain-containing protein [Bacillus sp. 1P10SD]|uniref:serine hydrolase domain-containing protein n=1 Tax=Bacillus sp. 1P10SD TaxID=3132265 RepID=UPI0039A4F289
MVRKIISFLLLPLLFTNTGFAQGQNDYEMIDNYIKKQMKIQAIEGLSYAIVKEGKIDHLQSFGNADIGKKLTPQTPMKLASLSKSFTSLAIMQLVEQGKVDLDSPVQKYIPWFSLRDKEASAKITVRHLLNQTSGISADGEVEIANELKGISLEETVRLLRKVELSHPVGSKFEYTNLNYLCLGLVVEKVSGESLSSYLEGHILTPLDMKNSYTSIEEAQMHGLSMGYSSWFGMHLPTRTALDDLPNFLASGYMTASAEDMGKYLLSLMNDMNPVLSAKGVKELQTPAVTAKMYLDGTYFGNYAMGWWKREVQGTEVIGHSGDLFSAARTDMYILLKEKIGVVVLTNTNNGRFTPGDSHKTTDGVISLLAGKQPIEENNQHDYQQHYLIMNSIVLGILVMIIISFLRLKKRLNKLSRPDANKKWIMYLILFQLFLPVALYLGMPKLLNFPSWSFLFCVQPDLVSSFMIVFILFFGLGILNGFVLLSIKLKKHNSLKFE